MLYTIYLLVFECLVLICFLPAHSPQGTFPPIAAAVLLVLATWYSLYRLRRLPRDIDVNIDWLATEGEERYNAVLEKLYGEPTTGQANS